MPRVLFLTQGDEKLASTRFRILEYLKNSPKGFSFCVIPLPKGGVVPRIIFVLKAAFKARHFDTVMVQKLLLPKTVLQLLKYFSGRLVYDFDDALFADPPGNLYQHSKRRKKKRMLEETLRSVDQVLCGNKYLAEFSSFYNSNCQILPTPVDIHVYRPMKKDEDGKLTVGWVGRAENLDYLYELSNVFSRLEAVYGNKVRLVVFCDKPFQYKGSLQVVNIPWKLEDEASTIASFDVGIMPLADDPWTRGKCSFKLIQYLACGVAGVASSVGMNAEVINHGINGFLANSEDEWLDCIDKLLTSGQLRENFIREGRSDVQRLYSLEANSPTFFEALKS